MSLPIAAVVGMALSVLLLARGPSGGDAVDETTIVVPSRIEEMNATFAPVSFGLLSGFSYDGTPRPGPAANPIPSAVRQLHGKKVSVEGFMLPLDFNGDGVSEFLLNASYDMCYFGAPTLPHQFVVVRMTGGRRTRFVHTPVAVYGTLRVHEERRSGRVVSLYQMDAEAIATGWP